MEIVLWVIGIHLLEIVGILGFLLIRKNQKLEEIIVNQQQQLEAISILINKMDEDFKQLDDKIWIEGDGELQAVFREMKDIQNILNSLK